MAKDRDAGNVRDGGAVEAPANGRTAGQGAKGPSAPAAVGPDGAAPGGRAHPDTRSAPAPGGSRSGPAARPDAPRHIYGPRPLGALVPALTRPAFRRRSPAGAQILADWAAIVGPELAAATLPRRLSGTTLTIACSGPMALELQHLGGALAGRINAHCGQVAVERLRFVQEALPPPPAPPRLASLGPAPELPGMPDGELRDALASLGRAVAGRGRS